MSDPTPTERSVIGAMIVDPDTAIDEVSQVLSAGDFQDDRCRVWFQHLAKLFAQGKPITHVSLPTAMKANKRNDTNAWEFCGGAGEMAKLINERVPTAIGWHANQIKFASTKRKLSAIAGALIEIANDDLITESDELISKSYDAYKQLEESGEAIIADVTPIAKVCDEVEKRLSKPAYEAAANGLPWSVDAITDLAGPLLPGQLVIIAARPGYGKSSLAANLAEYTAERGDRVLFLTLEMTNVEIGERMACSMAGVDSSMIADDKINGAERQEIALKLDTLRKYPIDLVDKPRITTSEISALVRVQNRKQPIKLLIIDYLKLIRPDNSRDKRDQQVSQIVADLKALAKQLQIPLVLLAQLSRAHEQENREPRMSDLAESASIEQDSDKIAVICNPSHESRTNKEAKDNENAHMDDDRLEQRVVFKMLKNRTGRLGKAEVKWYPSITRFEDVQVKDYPSYEPAFESAGR